MRYVLEVVAIGALVTLTGRAAREEVAVLAGGCFWGVEAVFEHVKGVDDVTSGFANGSDARASSGRVAGGAAGYAESVRITYDPSVISYARILEIFFTVAHDPTQLDRQGPDVGPEYRSAIFYADSAQKRVADSVIASLTTARTYRRPIVTEVVRLARYRQAPAAHQNFMKRHPTMPYVVINDRPRIDHLESAYPELVREPRWK